MFLTNEGSKEGFPCEDFSLQLPVRVPRAVTSGDECRTRNLALPLEQWRGSGAPREVLR
jgi:hypothetical protein